MLLEKMALSLVPNIAMQFLVLMNEILGRLLMKKLHNSNKIILWSLNKVLIQFGNGTKRNKKCMMLCR
jgi:hypothetical protein